MNKSTDCSNTHIYQRDAICKHEILMLLIWNPSCVPFSPTSHFFFITIYTCDASNQKWHPGGKAEHLNHQDFIHIHTQTTSVSDNVSQWSGSYKAFRRLQRHLYRRVQRHVHPAYHGCLGWHRHPALLFIWYAKECCGAAPRSPLKYFTPHITQSGSSSIRMSSKSEVAPSQ